MGYWASSAYIFYLLFLIEKEKVHLYFTLFGFGLFLTVGFVIDNYATYVMFPFWRDYHIHLFFFGMFLSQAGVIKFTEAYFNYAKSSFFSKWLIPIFLFISVVVNLNALARYGWTPGHSPLTTISYMMAVILPVFAIAISFLMVYHIPKQKNVSKKFFLVAFFPLLLVILFQLGLAIAVSAFGISFDTSDALRTMLWDLIKTAVIAMLVLLALSTGYRTNRLKEEKRLSLQKNLADQKRINKTISRFVPNEFLGALNKNKYYGSCSGR